MSIDFEEFLRLGGLPLAQKAHDDWEQSVSGGFVDEVFNRKDTLDAHHLQMAFHLFEHINSDKAREMATAYLEDKDVGIRHAASYVIKRHREKGWI
jgi:hypothetical protein